MPPLLEVKLELQVRVEAEQAVGLSSWVSLTHEKPSCPCDYLQFHSSLPFCLSPLQAPDMVFQPSLDQDGFYNMVDRLLDEIFRFASLVPCVTTHLVAPDYHTDPCTCGCTCIHTQSMK